MNLISGMLPMMQLLFYWNFGSPLFIHFLVTGPFDIQVYGSQKGYLNKVAQFLIRNPSLEEILVIS